MSEEPDQTLEERVLAIEQYLAEVVKTTEVAHNLSTSIFSVTQEAESAFLALKSMVKELAALKGIDAEQFERHFKARCEFWHDHVLRQFEDQNPEIAAAIDRRESVSPDVETYPPMFDKPPP